jgi:hypothetical protein
MTVAELTSSIHMPPDFRFLRHFLSEGVDNCRFNFCNNKLTYTCANEVQASLRAMTIAESNREYEKLYQGVFKKNLKKADETPEADVVYSRLI